MSEVTKIKVGSREFDNQAEADAYILELEKRPSQPQVIQMPQYVPPPTVEDKPETIDGRAIEDVIIENPARYHKYMEEKARKIAKEELDRREIEKQKVDNMRKQEDLWWKDFYIKNPDLKDDGKIVKSELQESFSELGSLDPEKAKEELAKKARAAKRSLLERYGVQEEKELPNKKAGGLEGSQSGSSSDKKPSSQKPMNFADQVRQMYKRK